MSAIGATAGTAAEGRFFPDTYAYAPGSSDLAVLRRAHAAMERRLQAVWAQRPADSPLRNRPAADAGLDHREGDRPP